MVQEAGRYLAKTQRWNEKGIFIERSYNQIIFKNVNAQSGFISFVLSLVSNTMRINSKKQ